MLDKNHRISLAKPQKFGQKLRFDQIVLAVGTELVSVPKFAIVVPSKFCKTAVDRNRTKRLIWQSLSQLLTKIKPGVYKILVKGNFAGFSQNQTLEKIKSVFKKGHFLK